MNVPEETIERRPVAADDLIDWLLQDLVDLVNAVDGIEIGITLHVGGALVTGMLIGGKAYFEGLVQATTAANGDEDDFMPKWFSRYREVYDARQQQEDPVPSVYMHLRLARTLHNGTLVPQQGVFWRGRVNAVDGFSLGMMETAQT